ncbi:cupredoxin family copper-binding protein [Candidatus Acetothermia bacterium]|nr:cupredoxin family copper-binding protein [Candidatus Acetothermia bacterium]
MISGCGLFSYAKKSNPAPPQPPLQMSNGAAVQIVNFSFQPATVHIKAGMTVTWTQKDSTPHTVTSSNPVGLDSQNLSQGQQYAYTFKTPGTYEYHCSIHPSMHGTVIVDQ